LSIFSAHANVKVHFPNEKDYEPHQYQHINPCIVIVDTVEDVWNYIFSRSFKLLSVSDILANKNTHKFPSYILVDMGHKDIKIYIISDFKLIEQCNLGYGGSSICDFLVQLLKENNRDFIEKRGNVGCFL
jgi:hypothetical protein